MNTFTEEHKNNLVDTLSHGLRGGLGSAEKSCVMGSISLSMGLELDSFPPCVAPADRHWGVEINDGMWSTGKVRADALLPFALAAVNTSGESRSAWVRRVLFGTLTQILPLALEKQGLAKEAEYFRAATNLKDLGAAFDATVVPAPDGIRVSYFGAAEYAFSPFLDVDRGLQNRVAPRWLAICVVRIANLLSRVPSLDINNDIFDSSFGRFFERNEKKCDEILQMGVDVAMDAYREEGRG